MVHIVEASIYDYPEIAQLHANSWKQHYRGILSDDFLDNRVETERMKVWQDRFSSPALNQRVSIAKEDDGIVGFACLFLDDDPTFGSLIDNLHVVPRRQKSGIGRRLMKNCADIIQLEGTIKKMYLWVYDSNKNAQKAYESVGGKKVETVEKETEDGLRVLVCRYSWDDLSGFNT